MKRIVHFFIFMAMIASCSIADAQSPYYYRTGDTIVGRSPIYFYQWWTEDWLADPNHNLSYMKDFEPQSLLGVFSSLQPHGELLQYCYTETPLNIIGIATSCQVFDVNQLIGQSEPVLQEYVRLYEASESDFTLLKEKPVHFSTPVRYMDITFRDLRLRNYCCEEQMPDEHHLLPIREFYFDKPVTVYDSFYIGYTTENIGTNITYEDISPLFWSNMLGFSLFWNWTNGPDVPDCDGPCEFIPFQLRKFRHIIYDWDTLSPNYGDTIDRNWHWRYNRQFMLQFPIVVIDSSYIIPPYECPPVQSPRVAQAGDGQAVLLWDTHPDQNAWQLSYGPQGIEPDDGTIVNCPIQVGQVGGLDSCTHYTAYIRAVCNHDSICYSQWSDPLDIYFCDTASGGGTNSSITSALSLLTNIVPNPASTSVTVYSSFQLTGIEAYNLHGIKVLDTKTDGASTTIDIARWPRGIYIIIIHTPAGNVAKKLVVN